MKRQINFVVTDLDDTLWNWLDMWYLSFSPYLFRISKTFNIDIGELKNDFKQLHQKYGTTEASYIYKELNLLSEIQKNAFRESKKGEKSIIHEYYSLKKNSLDLYPGVLKSLRFFKKTGVKVIGFTESNSFFTKYRLKHLELDGLIDCIYSPLDFGKPESVDRFYPKDYWEPNLTEFRYLPKNTKKPAPEILEIILKDFKADKQNAIYVGDKIAKDIFMANEAGILAIYAEYGSHLDSNKYQLLREVTHWTYEDVQREIEFKNKNSEIPLPDYTLKESFDQLLEEFIFFRFGNSNDEIDNLSKNIIPVWNKIVDVQQHFNDIALRIRNIALTAFTFIIGGIGYLEKEELCLKYENITLPFSTILSGIGTLIIFAFFYMDRGWYHKLLVGAVKQGASIEKKWGYLLPEMGLAQAISESSPNMIFGMKIHSKNKFFIFYGILFLTLIAIGVTTFLGRSCDLSPAIN